MDKKGFFGGGYVFWCFAAGILAVAGMALAAGRKEISLREEFYGKLLAEQTAAGGGQTENEMEGGEETSALKEEETPDGDAAEATPAAGEETASREPQESENTQIRVLLMDSGYESYWHSQVTVQGNVPLTISGAFEETCPAGQPLKLSDRLGEGEQVTVTAAGEAEQEPWISVLSLERSQGTPAYEGSLTVTAGQEGFLICSQVDLETYLKYVVPSEMPSGYPAEALKAQAVCARTYAVRQMGEQCLAGYGADVDDSVSFQVYNNIGRQSATDEAVDATRGVIMAYGGEPIQAYFFSTSCGHTSTDEVWGGEGGAPTCEAWRFPGGLRRRKPWKHGLRAVRCPRKQRFRAFWPCRGRMPMSGRIPVPLAGDSSGKSATGGGGRCLSAGGCPDRD